MEQVLAIADPDLKVSGVVVDVGFVPAFDHELDENSFIYEELLNGGVLLLFGVENNLKFAKTPLNPAGNGVLTITGEVFGYEPLDEGVCLLIDLPKNDPGEENFGFKLVESQSGNGVYDGQFEELVIE